MMEVKSNKEEDPSLMKLNGEEGFSE